MKTKAFWLPQLLAIVCILAVGSVPMVYGDAHEAGEEMEMEMEEESGISGWFRTDIDSYGTQIWFGASHPMGSISLDTDIYVYDTFGEFDLGLGIPVVDSEDLSLTLIPMVGIGFDYKSANSPSSLIGPQLFTYLTAGSISLESWAQFFFSTPFDYDDDYFYTRNFLLYSLNDTIAIGPQVEASILLKALEEKTETGTENPVAEESSEEKTEASPENPVAGESSEEKTETGLDSLLVGLRINLSYGENNTLGLFVGYETQLEEKSEDSGITGRMTFVRTW